MDERGRVVHCRRQAFEVYIGRPSEFGNPYRMVLDGNRETVIKLFELYALGRMESDSPWREKVKALYGKTLGCYCAPKPCHGDVLLRLAANLKSESGE